LRPANEEERGVQVGKIAPRGVFKALWKLVLFFSVVSLVAEAKPYKGAEYRTKASYLYGKFEVRMKAIGCEGALASFFTYNDNYPNTPWNEIDIEILGRYTDDVQFNTITPGQVNHVSHQYVNFNPALDYHIYGFEWTPDYVAWFIDSLEVYRQTGSNIASLNQPQKIMMNVWIPAAPNWAGKWNDAVLPAFAYYDWVSYASYTPGKGTAGTGHNFTPQWVENFDLWDQTLWDKASHTWDGNNCDFVYENAVFQNGKLILCLTKEAAIGYGDTLPPSVLWARAEGSRVRLMFSEQVEQASAETKANFIIPNATVESAQLLPDFKTVILSVPALDTISVSGMLVQDVRDRWSPPNAMPSRAVSLIRQVPVTLPLKINLGGNAYQDYVADQEWSETVEYGRLDGQTSYFSGAQISGTSDQEVYRSETWGLCEYKVRVPNGRYLIALMMTENYFTSADKRKMDIVVESTQVETNLDLFARIGYRTAYQRATLVDVTDGTMDIHMQALLDNALLNGITIARVTTGVREGLNLQTVPRNLTLFPNYPNPFNGGTTIAFSLSRDDRLTLKVYDMLGRRVCDKTLGEFSGGKGQVFWDGHDDAGVSVASGVYYYYIEGVERSEMRKLVYLK
jgi:hypothetical protein